MSRRAEPCAVFWAGQPALVGMGRNSRIASAVRLAKPPVLRLLASGVGCFEPNQRNARASGCTYALRGISCADALVMQLHAPHISPQRGIRTGGRHGAAALVWRNSRFRHPHHRSIASDAAGRGPEHDPRQAHFLRSKYVLVTWPLFVATPLIMTAPVIPLGGDWGEQRRDAPGNRASAHWPREREIG